MLYLDSAFVRLDLNHLGEYFLTMLQTKEYFVVNLYSLFKNKPDSLINHYIKIRW